MIKQSFGNRLEMKLVFAVLLSLGVAALVFFTAVKCSFAFMDQFFYSSDYLAWAKERSLDRLQKFIDENNVSLDDLSPLDEWCRQERQLP